MKAIGAITKFTDSQNRTISTPIIHFELYRRYWDDTSKTYLWEAVPIIDLDDYYIDNTISDIIWQLDTIQINEWKLSNVEFEVNNDENLFDDNNLNSDIWVGFISYLSIVKIKIGYIDIDGNEQVSYCYNGVIAKDGIKILDNYLHTAKIKLIGLEELIRVSNAEDLSQSTASLDVNVCDLHSGTTIGKTAAGWGVNAYQYQCVRIITGVGKGQVRSILSNTATELTVNTWDTEPTDSPDIEIFGEVSDVVWNGVLNSDTTDNNAVGIIKSIYQNDTELLPGTNAGEYQITDLDLKSTPATITFNTPPSTSNIIVYEYLYWYTDKTFKWIVDSLLQTTGITNRQVEDVTFDNNIINNVTHNNKANWDSYVTQSQINTAPASYEDFVENEVGIEFQAEQKEQSQELGFTPVINLNNRDFEYAGGAGEVAANWTGTGLRQSVFVYHGNWAILLYPTKYIESDGHYYEGSDYSFWYLNNGAIDTPLRFIVYDQAHNVIHSEDVYTINDNTWRKTTIELSQNPLVVAGKIITIRIIGIHPVGGICIDLVETYAATDRTYFGTDIYDISQEFIANENQFISRVDIKGKGAGTLSESFNQTIQIKSQDIGWGIIAEGSKTITVVSTSSPAWHTFDLVTPVRLIKGRRYSIHLVSQGNTNNFFKVSFNGNGLMSEQVWTQKSMGSLYDWRDEVADHFPYISLLFKQYGLLYYSNGYMFSDTIDGTVDLKTWGYIISQLTNFTGTGLKIYTRTQAADSGWPGTWDVADWIEINAGNGKILSAPDRYLKIALRFTTTDYAYTSIMTSLVLSYFTDVFLIAVCNFTDMTVYDAIKELANDCDYEFGFKGEETAGEFLPLFFFKTKVVSGIPVLSMDENDYVMQIKDYNNGLEFLISRMVCSFGNYSIRYGENNVLDAHPNIEDKYKVNTLSLSGGQLVGDDGVNVAQGIAMRYYNNYNTLKRRCVVVTDLLIQLDISDIITVSMKDPGLHYENGDWDDGDYWDSGDSWDAESLWFLNEVDFKIIGLRINYSDKQMELTLKEI